MGKTITAIDKCLNTLDLFLSADHELGVMEVCRELHLHKSSISRILSSLEAHSYLRKSSQDKKYTLGIKVLALADSFLANYDLRTLSLPYLLELKKKTNETVNMNVLEGDKRVLLNWVPSDHSVRVVRTVGETVSLFAGAESKVLLANMPQKKINELIRQARLVKYASRTIMNKTKLKQEMKLIRKQGFAVSFEERLEGAASIAVPLKDRTGDVTATLSISGPTTRFEADKVAGYVMLLQDVAARLSEDLGYIEKSVNHAGGRRRNGRIRSNSIAQEHKRLQD